MFSWIACDCTGKQLALLETNSAVRTCGFDFSGNIIMFSTDKQMGYQCFLNFFDLRDPQQIGTCHTISQKMIYRHLFQCGNNKSCRTILAFATVLHLRFFLQRTTSRTCHYPAVSTRSPVLCGDLWESMSLPATKMAKSTSSAPRLEDMGVLSTGQTSADLVWVNCLFSSLWTVWWDPEEGEGAQQANQRHPDISGSHHVHHCLQGQHCQG